MHVAEPAVRYAYPATRHLPERPPNLSSKAERERLSPAALRTFFAIVERWGIRDEDARGLLGGVSNGPYYRWRNDPERTLDTDMLTRVSYLVGIYQALHTLHGDPLADEWVGLPNSNVIFGGHPPLQYMLAGGLPALQTVRRLLDARSAA